jgi:hypothetical protein
MVKKIKFNISKTGEVNLEVLGAVGKECEKLTEDFESLLGSISNKTFKDEYYQTKEENYGNDLNKNIHN